MIKIKIKKEVSEDMLNNISNDYEKSVGFLTRDLTESNAIEIAQIYESIKELANKVDINNLTGEQLTKYVFQRRAIKRKEATKAKVVLYVIGTGQIKKGDLFSTASNIQFYSTESKQINKSGYILAECIQTGKIGMVGANSITQIPITITGITGVINKNSSYDGFEQETDESLRKRYYEDLQKPATSGNIYHYVQWAKEINGVGDAKVFPTWKGKNTVKVLIINADKKPASYELVSSVQKYIDPNCNGMGEGVAPIGAVCTVQTAGANNINIYAEIYKESGFSELEIKNNITFNIEKYFKSIAFNPIITYVSYAKITSLILNSDGVIDANNIKLNNSLINANIGDEEVPVIGNITIKILES